MSLTLVPAYGRDYKNKREVLEAWNAGKDFMSTGFHGEGYVNKNDCPPGEHRIRYKNRTMVCVIKVERPAVAVS